jgi:hypothetical protein
VGTSNKKAKRLARQRAAQTGERYTEALAAVRLQAEAAVSEKSQIENQVRWSATIRLIHSELNALATLGDLDQVVRIEGIEIKNTSDSTRSFQVDGLEVNRRTTILFDDEVVTLAPGAAWSRQMNGRPVLVPSSTVQLELSSCKHQEPNWGGIEVTFLGSELGPLAKEGGGLFTSDQTRWPGAKAVEERITTLIERHISDECRPELSSLLAQHLSLPRGRSHVEQVADLECKMADIVMSEEVPSEVSDELLGLVVSRRHAILCMSEGRRLSGGSLSRRAGGFPVEHSERAVTRLERLAQATRARHLERWGREDREQRIQDTVYRIEEKVLPVLLSLPIDPQVGHPALFLSSEPGSPMAAWITQNHVDAEKLFLCMGSGAWIPLSKDGRSVIRQDLFSTSPLEMLEVIEQELDKLLGPCDA